MKYLHLPYRCDAAATFHPNSVTNLHCTSSIICLSNVYWNR